VYECGRSREVCETERSLPRDQVWLHTERGHGVRGRTLCERRGGLCVLASDEELAVIFSLLAQLLRCCLILLLLLLRRRHQAPSDSIQPAKFDGLDANKAVSALNVADLTKTTSSMVEVAISDAAGGDVAGPGDRV
jgi:hypothetical protein